MSEKQETAVLDNIRTLPMWKLLKKLVKEQETNDAMPVEIRTLFSTKDPETLMDFTLCPNPALAALARTRIHYEGQELGLSNSAGTIEVVDAVPEEPETNG